jgi:hypothetical protein
MPKKSEGSDLMLLVFLTKEGELRLTSEGSLWRRTSWRGCAQTKVQGNTHTFLA